MNKISIDEFIEKNSYPDYTDLVESYGYEIVQRISLGSYQGDIIMIVGDMQGQYGLLVTGYGSCSGCDALQACSKNSDYESLRESLCVGIIFYSPDKFIEYLDNKDWKGEYYGYEYDSPKFKEFLKTAKEDLILRQLARI